MSAFLGPIHYWLYGKIQLQEELIQSLLASAQNQGWDNAPGEKLDAACGSADLRPLEECIDQGNIHGWLQEKIRGSETRLAVLVTELLKADPARLSELEQTAYRFGQSHPIEQGAGADRAFQALTDSLLDGMPCDHVNRLLQQEEQSTVWQQTQCLHREFWEQAGGDPGIYYALRAQIIRGMLFETGLTFIPGENGQFEIRKEDCHVQH